jgi:transcriptional regulator with XRE-family HTH domain
MNIRLKEAIGRSGLKAYEVARLAGMHRVTLSGLIHEYRPPTADEKAALAEALNKSVAELFGETEEPVSA